MTRKLIATPASEIQLRVRRDWGPWRLDREWRVLYTDPDSCVGYRYEVDLDKCLTSAQVLDWICQITGKVWGTDEESAATVLGLVNALINTIHPQGNLCSSGTSKTLTKAQVRRLVAGLR